MKHPRQLQIADKLAATGEMTARCLPAMRLPDMNGVPGQLAPSPTLLSATAAIASTMASYPVQRQ